VPIAAWSALALAAAVCVRGAAAGPLEAVFAPLALPLLCFAVVGAALEGDGLRRSTRPLVALGASPARVAAATLAVACLAAAAVAALTGTCVALIAHGAGDPPIVGDALATAWVSALGGAAYAALFVLGASFGKRGGGRVLVLGVDWLLGSGTGTAALFAPRAHVRALLGGDAVAMLSGRASALCLVGLLLAYASLATARASRT
jgi:hypothetical protein